MNRRKKYYCLLMLSFALGFTLSSCSDDEPGAEITELGNVTSEMILLGNPLKQKYKDDTERVYARNVWDMHAFDNKIYFGSGNSSNWGPAPNAGPAVLWSYDVASQSFIEEYKTGDEQIHLIREFDNQLYIPGHDSRISGWEQGNYYRLESGEWKMYHIANAIHVYDMYKWDGKLFISILSSDSKANSIFISGDDGKSWNPTYCRYIPSSNPNGEEREYPYRGRLYNMFPMQGKLYVSPMLHYSGKDNVFSLNAAVGTTPLFLGITKPAGLSKRMERQVVFQNRTVYILAVANNDHQYLPLVLGAATDWQTAARLALPEGVLSRDIMVKNGRLIVLTSKQNGNSYINSVLTTSDISSENVQWKELFRFDAGAFARSFEYLNGVFYFGLAAIFQNLIIPKPIFFQTKRGIY